MAAIPDQLSRVEAALRKGLRKGAAAFLDDFLRRYEHGGLTDGAGASSQFGLREGMEQGWLTAWMLTGRELAALVRRRFPARGVRTLATTEQPPPLSLPPPLPLPAEFRTWLETHTIAEGGTAAVAVPRSGAEWLAEHEATVNKWVPREYVDRYLRTRMPPLRGVADRNLLEAARDMVAANEERGFGVRETMRSLRRDFPAFAANRLENIARTEGAVLYEHGRLSRYMADGLVTGVRFSAVMDDRTTETCAWHEGRYYKLEDPDLPTPPLHWQAIEAGQLCQTSAGPVPIEQVRPGMQVLTHRGRYRKVTMALQRTYQGVVHEIVTSGGVLRATPEHPILTARGWVWAEQVRAGDEIITVAGSAEVLATAVDKTATVVCDLSVDQDESYCIGGHFVHNCRSVLEPVLFNETPAWNTEQPVPWTDEEGKVHDPRPFESFGRVDPALLPPHVTPEELFRGGPVAEWKLPAGPAPMPTFKPASARELKTQDDIRAGRRKWNEIAKRWSAPRPVKPFDVTQPTRRGLSLDQVAVRARTLDNQIIRTLTVDEQAAVTRWTRYRYQRPMMRHIESGGGTQLVAAQSRNLLSALEKAPKVQGTVYRGLADIPDATIAAMRRQAAVHSEVPVASVRSTSLARSEAEKFAAQTKRGQNAVILELKTKSGVSIEPLSCYPWQQEVLLRPGTKYRIMELVEQEAKGGRKWYRLIAEEL